MNTKEAIEYLKSIIYDDEVCDFTITNADRNRFNDIIALLQQGEKYKKYKVMVEKYKEYLDKLPTGCDSLKFYRLLKKYFPKEMIK
jgi:hypothetical protein